MNGLLSRARCRVSRHVLVAMASLCCCINTASLHAGEVEPRPGVTFASTAISVKSVSKAGALVQSAASTPALLGWDRVRAITGPKAAEAQVYSSLSDRLWRLRLRAERDDLVLAEPLADELVQELADAPGPSLTTALATQIACRLRRGARTVAVDSWLKWLEAGADRASFFADAGPIDPAISSLTFDATGLIPELHPFWLDAPAVRAFAQRASPEPRTPATRLAWLYSHAAAFECGDRADATALPSLAGENAAVALVNEIVSARIGDAAEREKARTLLTARLAHETTGWKRQWLLAGLGRSLLRESSRDQKLLGVDAMLQAAGSDEAPVADLAAVCLAESIVTLFELGESAGATSLKADLFQRFSTSPVLTWPPLRKVPGTTITSPASSPPAPSSATSGSAGAP